MAEKNKNKERHSGHSKGAIYLVGIGPGGLEHLTRLAEEKLLEADIVVGYTGYIDLISFLIKGKEVFSTGMTFEVERCRKAIGLARSGKKVAVVSSGDSGIYGMAGLVLEIISKDEQGREEDIEVDVIPGIPAFGAAAAALGAPLMHDFASVSLSDLLTPWDVIAKRVETAAKGDFVIIFYNPRSSKRKQGLVKAVEIVSRFREDTTPVGIVRNATRVGEEVVVTRLGELSSYYEGIDMSSILIIGNSTTFISGERIITPRGYPVK